MKILSLILAAESLNHLTGFAESSRETTGGRDKFMIIDRRIINRLLVFALVILTSFGCLAAQTKKLPQPNWDWREHKAETIDYAEKYLVSNIERKLPRRNLAAWFQKNVGAKTKVDWAIAECGEENPIPEKKAGQATAMCIETFAQVTEEIAVRIFIQFGTFERGISPKKPVVRSIFLGDKTGGKGFYVENLGALPERLDAMKKSLIYFDPSIGIFQISGERPPGFEDFDAMWVETMDYDSKLRQVAVKKNGKLVAGQKEYALRQIIYDGKSWTFETAAVDGVSYQFDGKFVKLKLDLHGSADGDNVLHGHLIKFMNGKKTAEADLIFSFHIEGC
jgi:hypothetical protein